MDRRPSGAHERPKAHRVAILDGEPGLRDRHLDLLEQTLAHTAYARCVEWALAEAGVWWRREPS